MSLRFKIQEYWEESRGAIIAGIVLAVPSIIIAVSRKVRAFLLDTHTPLWFVLLLLILTGITIFLITKRRITTQKPPKVSFEDFVSCKINSVESRWDWLFDYSTRLYKIGNIRPVCPECGSDIYYKEYAEKYFCPNGHDISKYDMDDSWVYKYVYIQVRARYKDELEHIDLFSMIL